MNIKTRFAIGAPVVAGIMSLANSAFAVGTANTAVTGAFQTMVDDALATGNALVPIGIVLLGLIVVVKYGKRVFNKLS